MAKRKRRVPKPDPQRERDSYGKKFCKSRPILDSKDLKVILSKPIETSVHSKSNVHTHFQIINGVVCPTG